MSEYTPELHQQIVEGLLLKADRIVVLDRDYKLGDFEVKFIGLDPDWNLYMFTYDTVGDGVPPWDDVEMWFRIATKRWLGEQIDKPDGLDEYPFGNVYYGHITTGSVKDPDDSTIYGEVKIDWYNRLVDGTPKYFDIIKNKE